MKLSRIFDPAPQSQELTESIKRVDRLSRDLQEVVKQAEKERQRAKQRAKQQLGGDTGE